MPRSCATLDSKLSPRAYPSTAPRQARVTTGFRSAFQKVALETDTPPQINFSNKSLHGIVNRNKNHSNNIGVSGCQVARSELQQGGPHTDKATVSRLVIQPRKHCSSSQGSAYKSTLVASWAVCTLDRCLLFHTVLCISHVEPTLMWVKRSIDQCLAQKGRSTVT